MASSHPRRRIQQGLRALFAFARPVDLDLAARVLTPEQLRLFRRMRRAEQLHSLNVLRSVQAQGSTPVPPDLAVAALLHDVGKSRYPLALWQKTVAVLVRAFAPRVFDRLSTGDPRSLINRPFAVYVHHPAWSAELAEQVGTSSGAVWLIAQHQQPADQVGDREQIQLLKRLQRADDAN